MAVWRRTESGTGVLVEAAGSLRAGGSVVYAGKYL